MKTKIIVNKLCSPVKAAFFVVLMSLSFQASAEYYVVYGPTPCCAPAVVVKKVVVHHYYHKKYTPHKKKIYRPKRHVYPPVARCQIWVPDQCGCCGNCVVGHWEPCRYPVAKVYYASPESNLSVYGGERVDYEYYDRRTLDDSCPDLQIN